MDALYYYSAGRQPEVSYITCTLAGFLVFVSYNYMCKRSGSRLPPGPPALPILGSLPFLGYSGIRRASHVLRKKYGDIYTLTFAGRLAVVLNGYDLIRDALVKKGQVFSGRPDAYFFQIFGRKRGTPLPINPVKFKY